jgi:hypothetical protein
LLHFCGEHFLANSRSAIIIPDPLQLCGWPQSKRVGAPNFLASDRPHHLGAWILCCHRHSEIHIWFILLTIDGGHAIVLLSR